MTTTEHREVRTPAEVRRAKILAIVYLVLALVALVVFAIGTEGSATFGLSRPTDSISLPDLSISASGLRIWKPTRPS